MIDEKKLESYLSVVVRQTDDPDVHAVLMRFLCRCLLLVQHLLKGIGLESFLVAKSYWLDGGSDCSKLLDARLECWEYLESKGHGTNIMDEEDVVLRAVICVLYAEPESVDFSLETVRWFFSIFNRLGNYSDEIEQLMSTPHSSAQR